MLLAIQIILSFIIGSWLGSKRTIGVFWSTFFCLTLSVVFGIIITLATQLKSDNNAYEYRPSKLRSIIGIGLIIISIIGIARNFLDGSYPDNLNYITLVVAIGFMGLGIYILFPPKGKIHERGEDIVADDPNSN